MNIVWLNCDKNRILKYTCTEQCLLNTVRWIIFKSNTAKHFIRISFFKKLFQFKYCWININKMYWIRIRIFFLNYARHQNKIKPTNNRQKIKSCKYHLSKIIPKMTKWWIVETTKFWRKNWAKLEYMCTEHDKRLRKCSFLIK